MESRDALLAVAVRVRAPEDLALERERTRYTLQQVIELRARVPDRLAQAAIPSRARNGAVR